MKIYRVRDCPTCTEFLKTHRNLDVKNVRNQKMRKNGTWFHTSWRGRLLHKLAIKGTG